MPTRHLLALFLVAFASAGRAQGLAPGAVVEQRRNVTNVTLPGQLAPSKQLGCIDVSEVRPDDTPPDLHTGVRRCIAEGRFDRAIPLVATAGVMANFDARRLKDITVRDTGQVLSFQTAQSMSTEQRTQFQSALTSFTADAQGFAALCRRLAGSPPPAYRPTYMILHGMDAVLGTKGDPLVTPFDPQATWALALKEYLHCT